MALSSSCGRDGEIGVGGDDGEGDGGGGAATGRTIPDEAASVLEDGTGAVAEAVAWRLVARWCGHRLKGRSGEGGDDGDGDGGGEAATGRTIMDEAASVPEAACAVACDTCS